MAIILRMFTFYGVVRSNNEPLTSSRHRLNSLVTAFLDMIAWACPSGRDASAAAAKIEELGPRCDGLWIAKCGRMVNVFIDAGHGGSCDAGSSSAFGGRSARGALEKDFTLALARRVAAHLGGDAALTRDGDYNVALAQRIEQARRGGGRAFVSIHAHGSPGPRGADQVWVHSRAGAASRALAGAVRREMASHHGLPGGAAMYSGDLAILTPERLDPVAGCMVEIDCLSDLDGDRFMRDEVGLERYGQAIARGVRAFLGGAAAIAYPLAAPGSYGPVRGVTPLTQPTSNACWATCFTMMYNYRNGTALTIPGAVATVGEPYVTYLARDQVLPWTETQAFMNATGLTVEAPASYPIDEWIRFLSNGPVWLSYHPGAIPTAGATHMVILAGIETDGTDAGSTVYLVDPAVGAIITDPFLSFNTKYENRVVRTGFPYPQIFHW
jgi:N-acetylmuramoyl-L-alanine amidase